MKQIFLALAIITITTSAITAPVKKQQYTCKRCGMVTTKKDMSEICPKSPSKKGPHNYEEIK